MVKDKSNETDPILEEESRDGEEESDDPVNEDTLRLKSVTTGGTGVSTPQDSP